MVKENRPSENGHTITPYTVEVEAFEIEKVNLSEVPINKLDLVTSRGNASDRFTNGTNLLDKVEKSYDKGVKVLAVSEDLTIDNDGVRMKVVADAEKVAELEAKENGTYLKAPNGKTFKLSPKQWVQVRTSRFKEWFGDWELAARYFNLMHLPSVRAANMPPNKTSKEVFNSLGYAKNEIDGTSIRFFTSAYKKVIKLGGLSERVIASLPLIFEKSILAYTENDNRGGLKRPNGTTHKSHPNLEEVRNYVGKVFVDGLEYYVRFTVHIQKNNNGLHSYFATDVSLYKLNSANSLSVSNLLGARVTVCGIIDTKLETFLQNAKLFWDNSSKIVDENGELMVVYHGTDEEFYEFTLYEDTGVTNRYDERPSDHFLFTPSVIAASDYGKTMPLYIRAEKLLRVDDKYDVSDIISKKAIGKYLDKTTLSKSDNQSIHLSALKRLPDIISESIFVEIHPNYKKGDDGLRSVNNGVGSSDLLVYRMYGAITIEENTYRVKTTLHEFKNKSIATTPHSYEVTEIELIESPTTDESSSPLDVSTNSIAATNLLQGVEKSYDKGDKVLAVSENLRIDNDGARVKVVADAEKVAELRE